MSVIKIKTLNANEHGKAPESTLVLDVTPETTQADIRKMIQKKIGIPSAEQRLIFEHDGEAGQCLCV